MPWDLHEADGGLMGYKERLSLLEKIGADRDSQAILYATSDRPNMDTPISQDAFDYFVQHLDKIWPNSKKITLILHTAGGDTSAAWRIINLLHIFCDELEVIIPNRAHSAGTLMSLGAKRILMTKQATLGPIDPSLSGPLSPAVPNQPHQRVPVSVEAVQGYIDIAKNVMGIGDQAALGNVLVNLSHHIHPLVLGQIFRSRNQIRSLAENLLESHELEPDAKAKIIDFLCSESGSHDRTINRREAKKFGLAVENPSDDLYQIINTLYEDMAEEMQLRTHFEPMMELQGQPNAQFTCVRSLLESVSGGSTRKVTKGAVALLTQVQQGPMGPTQLTGAQVNINFEGWEQIQ